MAASKSEPAVFDKTSSTSMIPFTSADENEMNRADGLFNNCKNQE